MHYHVAVGQEGGYLPHTTYRVDELASIEDIAASYADDGWDVEGDPQVGYVLTPPGAGPNTLDTLVEVEPCQADHAAIQRWTTLTSALSALSLM